MFLGAPLFNDGLDSGAGAHIAVFERISERLLFMTSHESFFFYKNCLAMPRWLHFLRTSPCSRLPILQMLDDVQRTLSAITHVVFLDTSWTQATLPVRWGGLGVKSMVDLAPRAFLASSCLVRPLVLSLLAPSALDFTCPDTLAPS